MSYEYPADLMGKVADAPPPLVAPELLRRALPVAELAYHASFLTDESRPTLFTLLVMDYGPDNALLQHTKNYIKIESSEPLTPPRLAKFSQAVDQRHAAIHITFDCRLLGFDPAGMRGLHGSSIWRQGPQTAPRPRPIWISADAPGSIRVGSWVDQLGRLAGGKIFLTPDRECGFWTALSAVSTALMREPSTAAVHAVDPLNLGRILYSLMARVRDAGHGGAVVLVPDEDHFTRSLRIGYQPKRDLLSRAFMEYVLAARTLSPRDDPYPFERIQDRLDEALDYAAGLAGVDGAIVLDHAFRVCGFGAELRADAPGLESVSEIVNGKRQKEDRRIDDFGTRHRSMFRFCHEHPAAIGFVMSQDGGIKGVRTHEDQVELWDPVWVRSPYGAPRPL